MTLLERVREVEDLLKKENPAASDLATTVSKVMNCNTYLINSNGDILSMSLPNGADCSQTAKDQPVSLKADFKQRMAFTFQTVANLSVEGCFIQENGCENTNNFISIVPIRNVRSNSGHLLFTKKGEQFSDEELIIAEAASLVASIFFYEFNLGEMGGEVNVPNNVQMVLDSLSFSVLKAISNVFNDLDGLEGFLVASKIADRIGISRSVIVNAMRKLESAGVVDSRSLGIKGTYIKVKNPHFLDALREKI